VNLSSRTEQTNPAKARRAMFSALWQADATKVRRCAPMDFIGRHLKGFFDYGIADEVHELKGDTAQGAALGTIASCAQRTVILTGTLNGGYADELYNILFRLNPRKMLEEGFAYGDAGMRAFSEAYGVLEKVTTITPADNACSDKPKVTTRVRRRPGASPLLFGRFLMELGAFVSLEDISDALPSYEEEVLSVEMDVALGNAYKSLEEDIKAALEEHHGNQSVVSTGLNALMLYPDRPFHLGTLYGYATDPDSGERERFVISDPPDLDENVLYAKERRLVEEVKAELGQGRRCQIYAVYTQKRDVTQRLKNILSREGIRVEVLTTAVPPEAREAWYERQVKAGMQVCVAHPRLVATGLDYVEYEGGWGLFLLKRVCARSETDRSEDTGFACFRVLWITVASRITRQPFRARVALRTSAATSSIWLRGNEKAVSSIFSANAIRNLRSPWRATLEYASQAYAKSSRWRNSVSTNRSWPRLTCNP